MPDRALSASVLVLGLPLALLVGGLACRGAPPLSPEDARDCSLAHGAAVLACDPGDVDPLAAPRCADALREVVRSCSPRLGG